MLILLLSAESLGRRQAERGSSEEATEAVQLNHNGDWPESYCHLWLRTRRGTAAREGVPGNLRILQKDLCKKELQEVSSGKWGTRKGSDWVGVDVTKKGNLEAQIPQ
jgi:hypothetical protein